MKDGIGFIIGMLFVMLLNSCAVRNDVIKITRDVAVIRENTR